MICNYALHVKGHLGYVTMVQEGSVEVKKVQIRVIGFTWGQGDQNMESWKDLIKRFGDGFYKRNVFWWANGCVSESFREVK